MAFDADSARPAPFTGRAGPATRCSTRRLARVPTIERCTAPARAASRRVARSASRPPTAPSSTRASPSPSTATTRAPSASSPTTCSRASSPRRSGSVIERGLAQRIAALNLFLKDIYHDGRILADGVVPRELVYSCPHYRREMRGLHVPPRTSTSRSPAPTWSACHDGSFVVLEDNLRVPSGVSYMLANRAGDEARLPRPVHALRRAADRPLRPGSCFDAAQRSRRRPRRARRSCC